MNILQKTISTITLDEALKFTKLKGIEFSKEEGAVVLKLLKSNINLLTKEGKSTLLNKIKKEVNQSTYMKVLKLTSLI